MALFTYEKVKQAFVDGGGEQNSIMAVQIVGMIEDGPACANLIPRIMKKVEETTMIPAKLKEMWSYSPPSSDGKFNKNFSLPLEP